MIYDSETVDVIILASGSEVSLAIEGAKAAAEENIGVRVVSMPSMDIFKEQSAEYKESVIPSANRKRLAIEAGSSDSWAQFVGLDGDYLCIDQFGASAPGDRIFKEYGFTTENVLEKIKNLVK